MRIANKKINPDMKRVIDHESVPEELLECVVCRQKEIRLFVSEEAREHVLLECMACGAYSELLEPTILSKYAHRQPKKVCDRNVRWVSQMKPKSQQRSRRKELIDRTMCAVRSFYRNQLK